MNKIAQGQCEDILASFKSDSTGLPNTYAVRALELQDASTAKYRWFKYGYVLTTPAGRRADRLCGIFSNSFSEQRDLSSEYARSSLTSKERK